VGVYRGKRPGPAFELRYDLVALDPGYETPEGKDKDNPIHALFQRTYGQRFPRQNANEAAPQTDEACFGSGNKKAPVDRRGLLSQPQ
jgi:hypothetical protein